MSYTIIQDQCAPDDGWSIDLGQLPPDTAWWDVSLPACPDCCGLVVWYEAGYVPGTRKCTKCGSLFHVACHDAQVTFHRERFQ